MLVPKDKVWETFLEGINSFTDDYFDVVLSRHEDDLIQEDRESL